VEAPNEVADLIDDFMTTTKRSIAEGEPVTGFRG
jgi:hypothetical protein